MLIRLACWVLGVECCCFRFCLLLGAFKTGSIFLCLFILARVCACFVVRFGVLVNKRVNRLLCFDLDSLFCTSANKRISFMT